MSLLLNVFSVSAQTAEDEQASEGDQAGESATATAASDPELAGARGYFFGYNFGIMLKDGGNEDIDTQMLLNGLKDSLSGASPALTQEQQDEVVSMMRERQQAIAAERQAAEEKAGEENLQMGKEFLAENAEREGVEVTDSGLQFMTIEAGDGDSPKASDQVVVHYEGRLVSGEVFDSSRQRGQPAEFGLQQVIPGWTEGLQLMKAGGSYRLFVPSDLAYGPGGTGSIPPNAVLIFDVELLEIKGN